MSAPEDDDDLMIADHGTVIMDRKPPQIPARAVPPNPPPPPSLPHPGSPMTQQPPLSTRAGLPVLHSSITGIPPQAPAKAEKPPERLVAIVAGAAFVIVFVLGALLMLLVRLFSASSETEPSAEPAAITSAAPVPAPSPALAATTEGSTNAQEEPTTRVVTPPPPSTRGSTQTRTPAGTKGSGKRRISDDL